MSYVSCVPVGREIMSRKAMANALAKQVRVKNEQFPKRNEQKNTNNFGLNGNTNKDAVLREQKPFNPFKTEWSGQDLRSTFDDFF